ncbi:MAG: MCE family protein [Flavobacteriaceae bacterium]|nr:MCE family protein [Flavobacteriaceae bacterium]
MKKNIITGSIVVVALVLLFFGFNFLKGRNLFEGTNVFYATYPNVDGLKNASKVTIRGMKVGEVQDIAFTSDKADLLVVAFVIADDYKIPKGTTAQIIATDIMGSRSLELHFPSQTNGEYLVSGDTLKGKISQGLKEQVTAQVLPLKEKVEKLMTSLDLILGKKSQQNLVSAIENMDKSFKNIAQITHGLSNVVSTEQQNMQQILQNFASISKNLEQNNDKIQQILSNVASLSDTLTRANLGQTLLEGQKAVQQLSGVLSKVQKGEGSLGALLNDKQLYRNLEATTASMERLLTDVRLNPKKYVRFSLISTGGKSKSSENQKIYRIQIYRSAIPVELTNPIFKGNTDIVEMQSDKGDYLYTIGYTADYDKLEKILKKLRKDFPNAYIMEDKR